MPVTARLSLLSQSYHMHAGRQTHAIALLFNAAYVCRLQVVFVPALTH